jgi:hypothetical protein
MRSLAPLGLALAIAGASASCTSGSGVVAPIGAPSPREADTASTSPATWIYHPSAAQSAHAAFPLGDGTCVVVTADGERWLVGPAGNQSAAPAKPGTCKGDAIGAAFGAPEPLRRIVRAGGTFRFVGESGTLYEAAAPLASFSRVLTPPTRLGRVATQGEATVGVSSAGDVYRLEQDGWVRGDTGGARLFDVEVDDAGRALAIAWPERVLLSRDGGRTFRPPSDVPKAIGALAVRGAPGSPLAAVGVRGQLVWPAGGDALKLEPVARGAARTDEGVAQIHVRAIGPKAQAAAPARAVLTGSRWYEVRAASELPDVASKTPAKKGGDEGWVLVRGRLGTPLDAVPLEDVPADHEVRIGANGTHLVLGFMERAEDEAGGPMRLTLRASSDEGRTFRPLATLAAPDIRQVRIAIAPNGDALVTGTCPIASTKPDPADKNGKDAKDGSPSPLVAPLVVRGKPDDGGCRPRAPVLVKAAGKGVTVGIATDLRGLPVGPAFSADGSSLYFLGKRAKGQEPSLFRSDDGGATWTSRPLVRRGGGSDDEDDHRPHFESEDGESWEDRRRGTHRLDLIPEEPLTVDADGTLGVVVDTSSGHGLLAIGADGEVRGVSQPPEGNAIFAAHGRRALAALIHNNTVTTWETSDGGATWEPAGVLRARFEDGEGAITCGAGGCVVGDAVTRVGWDAREEDARQTAPPVARPRPPSIRTPIVCDLDAKPWTVLEGVEPTALVPTIDEIARGKSSWSLMSVDTTRGSVTVHAALTDAGEPPRITSRPLLEPVPTGKTAAVRALRQGEGYAAARLAEGKKALDVAWVNYFEGAVGKRSVEPKKAVSGSSLRVGLMSVSTGGIFIQPGDARDLAFLDTRGGTSWSTPPDWNALGIPGRTKNDATRVGGRTVHVGLLEAGPHVGLLATDANATSLDATTLAPPRTIGATSVVSWAYLGVAPGFAVVAAEAGGDGWSSGSFRPFAEGGTLGAPVAIPTLVDLPDRPRPCRGDDFKTTPRVESPMLEPGTSNVMVRGQRHLVEVPGAGDASSPDGTLRLLTAGAVLHGTPKDPCLAGWEVAGFDGRRGGAVISGDLTRAWVFRLAATTPRPGGTPVAGTVEIHGMACRYDPGTPIPSGAWDELGVK